MTREEQIENEASIYTNDTSNYAEWSDDGGWSETNDIKLIEKAFIQGAEWADETMIDKVCKWLYKSTYKHADDSRVSMNFEYTIDMIEDFKKAMEE
jgi:hypothetical protein